MCDFSLGIPFNVHLSHPGSGYDKLRIPDSELTHVVIFWWMSRHTCNLAFLEVKFHHFPLHCTCTCTSRPFQIFFSCGSRNYRRIVVGFLTSWDKLALLGREVVRNLKALHPSDIFPSISSIWLLKDIKKCDWRSLETLYRRYGIKNWVCLSNWTHGSFKLKLLKLMKW